MWWLPFQSYVVLNLAFTILILKLMARYHLDLIQVSK